MLPDLRNLGTILRVLFAVNGAALAVAFAREQRWSAVVDEWVALTSVVEPYLLAELAVLAMASPRLVRLPYRYGVAAIAGVTVVVGVALHQFYDRLLPGQAGSLPRQLAFALGAVAVLLYYFQLRIRALSPAITEARLQALQARIRPHFLFNSINAVLSLVRSEPQRAEAALEDMADLFRVLMADNRTLVPIASELELARQYLAIESIRLGERLRITWRTDGLPPDALVPPLLLQPLVENAVYHGIEPTEAGGEIEIDGALMGRELVISLRNPFPGGGRHSAGNRMAIVNIRERLQLHFDAEASMRSEVKDGSYKVTLRMPYLVAPA